MRPAGFRSPPGWLMAVAAAASWGLSAVAAKDLFAAVPPARLAQLRALVTAVLLLGGLLVARRSVLPPLEAFPGLLGFGACLALVNGAYYLAIGRLPIGVALTIQYTGPLFVLLVRRRRVTRRLWAAALCALVGAALVAGVTGGVAASGTGLAIAAVSAFGFAGYLLLGEGVSRRVGPVTAVAWGFATASVVWSVILPWWRFPASRLSLPGVPWRVAVVCLVGTVLPFLLMLGALRSISAGPAGVLATAEPAFGALFAWLLLGEALAGVQVLGLVLVVAGVAAVQAGETSASSVERALELAD